MAVALRNRAADRSKGSLQSQDSEQIPQTVHRRLAFKVSWVPDLLHGIVTTINESSVFISDSIGQIVMSAQARCQPPSTLSSQLVNPSLRVHPELRDLLKDIHVL